MTDSETPVYRGMIVSGTTDRRLNVFIGRNTLEHVSGPRIAPPHVDLIVWVDRNKKLPRTLADKTWLIFSLRKSEGKESGWKVFNAEVDS